MERKKENIAEKSKVRNAIDTCTQPLPMLIGAYTLLFGTLSMTPYAYCKEELQLALNEENPSELIEKCGAKIKHSLDQTLGS